MAKEISDRVIRRCWWPPTTWRYMVALIGVVPSLAVSEVPTTNGVETGLEPSMLCLLKRSMAYFC